VTPAARLISESALAHRTYSILVIKIEAVLADAFAIARWDRPGGPSSPRSHEATVHIKEVAPCWSSAGRLANAFSSATRL